MTEDTFTTPDSWRRSLLPRRGGLPVTHRPVAGWKDTVAASLSGTVDPRAALTHPSTQADLRDAGLAYLDAALAHLSPPAAAGPPPGAGGAVPGVGGAPHGAGGAVPDAGGT